MIWATWRTVLDILERWAPLGECAAPSGARLIGHLPHVAPRAYLHEVYPGLSEAEVRALERRVGRSIPAAYRTLLRTANGSVLFGDRLRLNGLRRSYVRDAESAREPYAMETANVEERPKGSPDDAVFIGGYSYDGSRLFIRPGDPRVHRCPQEEFEPLLNTWPSLDRMLLAEVDRLAKRFDAEGRLIDSSAPTTPVPD